MKCLILAAGKGTRLKDLTTNTNKCSINVGGKPIISRIVENFEENNVKDINIITGYCKEAVEKCIKSKVNFIYNKDYSDSILISILAAEKELYGKPFILSTGDVVFHEKILPGLLEKTGDVVVAVKRKLCSKKDVKVVVENDLIKMFEENCPEEKAVGEFGMMAIFNEETSKTIFETAKSFIDSKKTKLRLIDTFNAMINKGYKFIPYYFEENLSIEVDTLEDLEKANELIKNFENKKDFTRIEEVYNYVKSLNLSSSPKVSFIDIGNVNYTYKISDEKENSYLKFYGLTTRKTTEAIELIGYTPKRFENEVESIKYLNSIFKDKFKEVIPKIKFVDYNNRILIISDIADEKENLKDKLLNNFDVENLLRSIKSIAEFIAEQHLKTIGKKPLNEDEEFNKRFYDFRTIHSCKKLNNKEQEIIKNKAEELLERNKTFSCLINADLSPKQIFVNKDKIGMCDFELLSSGIASYDIGFFIANLKIIEVVKEDKKISKLIEGFIKTYIDKIKEVKNTEDFIKFTKDNLNFFIGLSMLNRIDAVPLEQHIPLEKTEKIREEAKKLIFTYSLK